MWKSLMNTHFELEVFPPPHRRRRRLARTPREGGGRSRVGMFFEIREPVVARQGDENLGEKFPTLLRVLLRLCRRRCRFLPERRAQEGAGAFG